ncbi:kinase-like domain-containing protein [Daldinia sp. FL1419]|nr:kinase-like domain-containing protein [Daldinia sp. FL1419]
MPTIAQPQITALDMESQEEIIQYRHFNHVYYEEDIENIQMSNKSGYHPVHLGDILDDRYEVVHKLGSGGGGIVWLLRDMKLCKWRAVKIATADRSSQNIEEKIHDHLRTRYTPKQLEEKHVLLSLERFGLSGPDSCHICFVMPVLGWSVSSWRLEQDDHERRADADSRNMCYQIVETMHFLHQNGICHGDFKPGSIIMKIEGINDLNVDRILEITEKLETISVKRILGEYLTMRAPKYCVMPVDEFWCENFVTTSIAVIDFGESFFIGKPPARTGIPNLCAAPGIIFPDIERPMSVGMCHEADR